MVQIGDGLFYYIHPFGANCDVYVFREEDSTHFDMIDTGIKSAFALRPVVKGMARDGIDPKNVGNIYHTHAHFDHTQADRYFQRKAQARHHEVQIFCPEPDLFRFAPEFDLVRHNMEEIFRFLPPQGFEMFRRTFWTMKLAFHTILRQPSVTGLHGLQDGDQVTIGGRNATVLTTGGHTEGHSFFRFDKEKILVVGDNDAPNETTVDFEKMVDSMGLAREILTGWVNNSKEPMIMIGHNPIKRGVAALNWAQSYLDQFFSIFNAIVPSASKQRSIDVTTIMERVGGFLVKLPVQIIKFFAFMRVFVILKFLQQKGLGRMRLSGDNRLIFEAAPDIEMLLDQGVSIGRLTWRPPGPK